VVSRPQQAPSAAAHRLSDPLGAALGVADHRLLDRLIRGRIWIGIIAFALIGIVAMQVAVLKLNTGTASALETKSTLMREISAAEVASSTLGSGAHIEAEAVRRGMVMAAAAPVGVVTVKRSDADGASALLASSPAQAPAAPTTTATPATPATPATSSVTAETPTGSGDAAVAGSEGTAGGAASVPAPVSSEGTAGGAAAVPVVNSATSTSESPQG
jgi:hypothetical protein